MEHRFANGRVLRLMQGDITKVAADAIANAANSGLAGGGGVDGAIHRAGGPSLMEELNVIRREKGRCPAGNAVVTSAGRLPAKYVFHAVGPVYGSSGGKDAELLASCYSTCLRLATELGLKSIAFPSISTGAYGYPKSEAALVALTCVAEFLWSEATPLQEVMFVLFDQTTLQAYERALGEVVGPPVE